MGIRGKYLSLSHLTYHTTYLGPHIIVSFSFLIQHPVHAFKLNKEKRAGLVHNFQFSSIQSNHNSTRSVMTVVF